jgi:hypothetical protein
MAASGRTPGAGMTSAAMRLPKVMVPVLSSSSTSTSPAASTARPEVARTLTFSSRSMPAMPTAESRPPMVVGISVRRRARPGPGGELDAGIGAEAQQGDDGDQEDQGQAGQQDGERDLVRRLAAVGAFHHGDHAVEEARARLRR